MRWIVADPFWRHFLCFTLLDDSLVPHLCAYLFMSLVKNLVLISPWFSWIVYWKWLFNQLKAKEVIQFIVLFHWLNLRNQVRSQLPGIFLDWKPAMIEYRFTYLIAFGDQIIVDVWQKPPASLRWIWWPEQTSWEKSTYCQQHTEHVLNKTHFLTWPMYPVFEYGVCPLHVFFIVVSWIAAPEGE